MTEFVGYCFRDRDSSVQPRQQLRLSDQYEIAQRGGVGNDTLHDSEAEPPVSLAILFKIRLGVFQPDLVLLEKPVELIPGFKSQKLTQLGGTELAFTIRLKGDCFKRGAREILARRSQCSRKILGKINGELLHEVSIRDLASNYK